MCNLVKSSAKKGSAMLVSKWPRKGVEERQGQNSSTPIEDRAELFDFPHRISQTPTRLKTCCLLHTILIHAGIVVRCLRWPLLENMQPRAAAAAFYALYRQNKPAFLFCKILRRCALVFFVGSRRRPRRIPAI